MTEEIKEILDDLGNKDNYIEEFGYQYKRISLYDSFQLLDYITNLQQENKILKENAEHNDKVVDKAKWNEMIYKSRCEKAIEYIENNKKETSSHFNGKEYVYRNFTLCCEPNDLLNILNGENND